MGKRQSKEELQTNKRTKILGEQELWIQHHTKYTIQEVKIWSDKFLAAYPDHYITRSEFSELYARHYPNTKKTSLYVEQVFQSFDTNHNDKIDFKEFIVASGIMCRGSVEEKLHWMFSLFDINNDGEISKSEMLSIMRGLYKLNEKRASARLQHVRRETPVSHVERIFKQFDKNNDQKLTLDEFLQLKDTDPKLLQLVFGRSVDLD